MNLKILSLNLKHLNEQEALKDYLQKFIQFLKETEAEIIFIQEIKESTLLLLEKVYNQSSNDLNIFKYVRGSKNIIFSKYNIDEIEKFHLVDENQQTNELLLATIKYKDVSFYVASVCFQFSFFNLNNQYSELSTLIEKHEQRKNEGLIISGNFYDWGQSSFEKYEKALNLTEVFKSFTGEYARSYPTNVPIFCLDRIYIKRFQVIACEVLYNEVEISAHLPLLCQLRYIP